MDALEWQPRTEPPPEAGRQLEIAAPPQSRRPQGNDVERELERLPEVVSGRLLVDGDGGFVGAYVVVRRDAMLKRVARDVRSTVAVATGVDLALDQILVVEQHVAGSFVSAGGAARATVPPPAVTSSSSSPTSSSSLGESVQAPPGALDRAAARLLNRSLRAQRDNASRPASPRVPAWGELVVR